MEKKEQLYEGKAKIIYATEDPELLIQYFKDDATAFNAKKKGTIEDKGIMKSIFRVHRLWHQIAPCATVKLPLVILSILALSM